MKQRRPPFPLLLSCPCGGAEELSVSILMKIFVWSRIKRVHYFRRLGITGKFPAYACKSTHDTNLHDHSSHIIYVSNHNCYPRNLQPLREANINMRLEPNTLDNEPQYVRAYLRRQRQHQPSNSHYDEEREREMDKALQNLPDGTLVYQYQSVSHLEATTRAANDYEYRVFVDVPVEIVDHSIEDLRIGKIQYYSTSKILVVRIPGVIHESAATYFERVLDRKLVAMNCQNELRFLRATRFHHKEGDASFLPKTLPPNRSYNWPSLVLEVGLSEGPNRLGQDAHYWLNESNHLVRSVITMKITKTQIIITRNQGGKRTRRKNHILKIQRIVIRRNNSGQHHHMIGAPLTIPFEDLFLRLPGLAQGDIKFNNNDLQAWADETWYAFDR